MTNLEVRSTKHSFWLWSLGGFGAIWNLYGIYQFLGTFSQNQASLMTKGMTSDQAAVYLSLPVWTSFAFAVGVVGGLAGSAALMLRRKQSVAILTASLAGYLVLFAGDVAYGVFANIPAQLMILGFVVIVAVTLLAVAWTAQKQGQLI